MFSEIFKNTLSRIPAPEPNIPKDKSVLLSENDDDLHYASDEGYDTLSSALFITYVNAKGEMSRRRIALKKIKFSAGGNKILCAYCFETKAYKEFRVDRISSVIDIESGEIIEEKSLLEFNFSIVRKSPNSNVESLLKKILNQLIILVYIARCDGHFHQEEEQVILHYLMDEMFNVEFDAASLILDLKRFYPEKERFFNSIDYLEKNNPKDLEKLKKYISQLIQADGVIACEEFSCVNEMHSNQ